MVSSMQEDRERYDSVENGVKNGIIHAGSCTSHLTKQTLKYLIEGKVKTHTGPCTSTGILENTVYRPDLLVGVSV